MVTRMELGDWMHNRTDRKFYARIEEVNGTDIYINLYDQEGDQISIAAVQIENDGGRLKLRLWQESLETDPVIDRDITVDRDKLKWCLKCGDDWNVHNGDGGCVQNG
jgi:hypothetical protein